MDPKLFDIVHPTVGMNQDVDPKFQKEGKYRYALNAVNMATDGSIGNIINEPGNELCAELPDGTTLIGAVQTNTEDLILFLYAEDGDHEIGSYNPAACSYTTLIKSSCLEFSLANPVQAIFRIAKGCNRKVYFTDTVTRYKAIDLDELDSYKDDNGDWICNKFYFSPLVNTPSISIASVQDSGGSLKVGAYQYSIRYLDSDLNATDWLYVTDPINILDDASTEGYWDIDGGVNIVDSSDEEGAVPPSTKSVRIQLTNLDTTYDYYQLAAVVSLEGIGSSSTAYVLPAQNISSSSATFTHSANEGNGIEQTTVSDIIVDKIKVDVVQTHQQLDNRLFLAGIKERVEDWAAYQQAANDITVS